MKKLFSFLLVLTFTAVMAAPALAGAGEKLMAGGERALKSPLHIVDSVKEEWDAAEFKPLGAIGGTLKGLFEGVIDFGKGLVEVVTFPIDNEDYT